MVAQKTCKDFHQIDHTEDKAIKTVIPRLQQAEICPMGAPVSWTVLVVAGAAVRERQKDCNCAYACRKRHKSFS